MDMLKNCVTTVGTKTTSDLTFTVSAACADCVSVCLRGLDRFCNLGVQI